MRRRNRPRADAPGRRRRQHDAIAVEMVDQPAGNQDLQEQDALRAAPARGKSYPHNGLWGTTGKCCKIQEMNFVLPDTNSFCANIRSFVR
jgi:hypothetical protein